MARFRQRRPEAPAPRPERAPATARAERREPRREARDANRRRPKSSSIPRWSPRQSRACHAPSRHGGRCAGRAAEAGEEAAAAHECACARRTSPTRSGATNSSPASHDGRRRADDSAKASGLVPAANRGFKTAGAAGVERRSGHGRMIRSTHLSARARRIVALAALFALALAARCGAIADPRRRDRRHAARLHRPDARSGRPRPGRRATSTSSTIHR